MGLLDKAKEKALELKGATFAALSDADTSKVHEVIAAFNAGLPLLKEAGCSPTRADVDLGLSPKITAHFNSNDVSQEKASSSSLKPDAPIRLTTASCLDPAQ